jgi:hypothetical protein
MLKSTQANRQPARWVFEGTPAGGWVEKSRREFAEPPPETGSRLVMDLTASHIHPESYFGYHVTGSAKLQAGSS